MAATFAKDAITPLYLYVATTLDLIQALSIYIEPYSAYLLLWKLNFYKKKKKKYNPKLKLLFGFISEKR